MWKSLLTALDIPIPATTPALTTSSSTQTSSTTSTPVADSREGGDRSKAEWAGIAIGIISAVIGLIALVFAILQYRYIRSQSKTVPQEDRGGRWFWQRSATRGDGASNGDGLAQKGYAMDGLLRVPERLRLKGP